MVCLCDSDRLADVSSLMSQSGAKSVALFRRFANKPVDQATSAQKIRVSPRDHCQDSLSTLNLPSTHSTSASQRRHTKPEDITEQRHDACTYQALQSEYVISTDGDDSPTSPSGRSKSSQRRRSRTAQSHNGSALGLATPSGTIITEKSLSNTACYRPRD